MSDSPLLAEGNAVVLALNVTDSRVRPPVGEKEVGVPAGRAAVARSPRPDGKAGRTISLVIVSARVVSNSQTIRAGSVSDGWK